MAEAMSNSPEDILSKELAKLTGLSISVGSLSSGHTDGALGGGVTASSCEVTVTAAAKEGLIKQQTAQKAVQSVIGELKRLI
jgi:pectin methylesterase-like acyl-CoA thioesterase